MLVGVALQTMSAAALNIPATSRCTRRGFGFVATAGFVQAARADDEDVLASFLADEPPAPAVPAPAAPAPAAPEPAATSITYERLKELLVDCRDGEVCKVQKVVFTVESGETGDAVMVDGSRLPISGIPEENPTNDSSPAKLVAK